MVLDFDFTLPSTFLAIFVFPGPGVEMVDFVNFITLSYAAHVHI